MKTACTFLALSLLICGCKKKVNNGSVPCFDTKFFQLPPSEVLLSVFFLNGKDGYVAGNNGVMFKTNDSAKTWTPLNSTVTLPIYDLFFLNALEGFAVGGQTSCGGTGCIVPGGFILKTIDGGQTWTKVYTPVQKIEITSIDFVNASIGFCAGDNVVMKTTDGGQTWSEMKIDNLVGKMMQVKFIDHQKGFIVCLSDKIVKTEDGGLTWQITNPQLNIGYYSISAANGSIYVSGQRRTIKSTTNGSSWIDLDRSPSDIFVVHLPVIRKVMLLAEEIIQEEILAITTLPFTARMMAAIHGMVPQI